MALDAFHPATRGWFDAHFEAPSEPQRLGWPAIRQGQHTLIAAPTGSGKTLAAFLSAIDALATEALSGRLPDETRVLYVSPLKALSNDIQHNLQFPLEGIRRELAARGEPDADITTMVRTGDTPQHERALLRRRAPHILVTTPESLYILLTSDSGRAALATVRTVIVDEIHALVQNKRGSHLALSLERLEALTDGPLTRVGLSATQKPIEEIARFLVGQSGGVPRRCHVVDCGHARRMDLRLRLPSSPLEAVMAHEVWDELYDGIAELAGQHRTTLVFVNTRRLAERVSRHLGERLGEEQVSAHHGSMARERRLEAEQRLKAGQLSVLVATASLELGIDIGDVDLVCQLGSPRAIATLLQRVGRSGHFAAGLPKGRLFPLSRDDLVECTALVDAVRRGELDRVCIPRAPLDILAQQIVAAVACEEWTDEALFEMLRSAYPYRELPREDFDAVADMLAQGFATARGRRAALVHHDRVHHRLRPRRGTRLLAITCGGAIADTADYDVLVEPSGTKVGTVHEDFAVESMGGDVFQLGNASWRVLRVEKGVMRVEDAQGAPPTIPFWLGEAPGRTHELSQGVARVRGELDEHWQRGEVAGVVTRWREQLELPESALEQLLEYLGAARAALDALPTFETLVVERFFDESGGMQLVVHSPYGSRLNRAWGLALRKRFCRTFNFELQASATDDAIILSLGQTQSFELHEVGRLLHASNVRDVLVQALLDAPMFEARWRWNASRALAVPRFRGGKKVPAYFTRMQADDLLAAVFPDQQACQENLAGAREIPDHPLVKQTVDDCLYEAMDAGGLVGLLERIERGQVRVLYRELNEPSPLSQEILNARPYAFLDDAPLEERRTQAVMSRRFLAVQDAAGIGALDADAIAQVRAEAWPDHDSADELYDALCLAGFMTQAELNAGASAELAQLAGDRRATQVMPRGGAALWVAAERLGQLQAVVPEVQPRPDIDPVRRPRDPAPDAEAALGELVRSRLQVLGPVGAAELAAPLGVSVAGVDAALARLQAEGFALKGHFSRQDEPEWCERRLLARIHRYTVRRLRQEIQPISAADLMRFLFVWQRVDPAHRVKGPEALAAVIEQLSGFEAPAAAWESDILPARVEGYEPGWLDTLCLSGHAMWARLAVPAGGRSGARALRTTPVTLLLREQLPAWLRWAGPASPGAPPSAAAEAIVAHLGARGASFANELERQTGLLRAELLQGLAELVARGQVTGDGFQGLRGLLLPAQRRHAPPRPRSRRSALAAGLGDGGRWSLVDRGRSAMDDDEATETLAWALLRRYGVVFRRLLAREVAPPWRELARVYRRLEARGEIRGGRFVAGFTGEQFALPEAVASMRQVRRQAPDGRLLSISAADPLNLLGHVLPGERVPALAKNRILLRDGEPLALLQGGRVRFVAEVQQAERWQADVTLRRRHVPPALRAYV